MLITNKNSVSDQGLEMLNETAGLNYVLSSCLVQEQERELTVENLLKFSSLFRMDLEPLIGFKAVRVSEKLGDPITDTEIKNKYF